MVKDWRDNVLNQSEKIRGETSRKDVLGPLPVKSSLSITSAWTEFFFAVFPVLRAFSLAAFPESCEYERRPVGGAAFREAEVGAILSSELE